jgi:hypothetical protein
VSSHASISVIEFQARVAKEFDTAPRDMALDVPLAELGFDSLARTELLVLMDEVGLSVPTRTLLSQTTLRGLYESAVEAVS